MTWQAIADARHAELKGKRNSDLNNIAKELGIYNDDEWTDTDELDAEPRSKAKIHLIMAKEGHPVKGDKAKSEVLGSTGPTSPIDCARRAELKDKNNTDLNRIAKKLGIYNSDEWANTDELDAEPRRKAKIQLIMAKEDNSWTLPDSPDDKEEDDQDTRPIKAKWESTHAKLLAVGFRTWLAGLYCHRRRLSAK